MEGLSLLNAEGMLGTYSQQVKGQLEETSADMRQKHNTERDRLKSLHAQPEQMVGDQAQHSQSIASHNTKLK